MSTTIDLACTACAWVDKDNPTTNYHGAAYYDLQGYKDGLLFLSFETLAQQYWGYKVDSVTLNFTVNESLQSAAPIFFYGASEGFNESTLTYDTKPGYAHLYGLKSISSGSGDAAVSFDVTDSSLRPENIHFSLRDPALYFESGSISQIGDFLRVYTNYASSGKKPFLRVVVSDTLLIPDAEQEYPPSGVDENSTVLADQPVTVSWVINSVMSGHYGYGPVQSSAVFKWSTTNEAPWNEYEISGSDQFITFPANTFPAHGSIYWRVSITCYGGKTTLTSGYFHARLLVELALLGGANVNSIQPDTNRTWEYTVNSFSSITGGKDEFVDLFSFEDAPAAYAYNEIFSAGLYFKVGYSTGSSYSVIGGDIYRLNNSFIPNRVTWNTKPDIEEKITTWTLKTDGSVPNHTVMQLPKYSDGTNPTFYKDTSANAAKFAKAKNIRFDGPTNGLTATETRSIVPGAPMTLRLWFHDTVITSKPEAAKYYSGYVNRHIEQTFEWDLVPNSDYSCYGSWTQASAVFSYRAGTSGEWTTVAVSGSTQAVEIAANTLAAGTVQWKVQTTDDQGTTAESEVYTITTTDSAMTATPVAPINTIENGDAAIVFMWDTANDNGNPPTGADLQYSTDGSSWSDLGSVSGAATEYSAAAETFSNGTVYWRVRAYNADSVAGSWSDPVSFVCMAAPPMPVVSATEVPYATISWQSDGQQTYRVTVDGKSYGPYFGTKKSFDLPDYLPDGQHTATVEVQGSSGLWSHPGSVTFSVTNVPGDPVALTGKYSRDAALTWTTDSATADFYIYRDDVRIGHATGTRFTDRFVLGAHSYYVVNKLPGGYYTRSNIATGTMRSCTRAVAAFAGGGWLEMALSDDSDTEENFSWTMTASERHVTGAAWPVVERSPYTDGSGSYRISFADVETGAAFEALRGQRIIVKSRGGNVVIGVMTGYQKTMTNFYLTYVFTVRRCDWRDYVDAGD